MHQTQCNSKVYIKQGEDILWQKIMSLRVKNPIQAPINEQFVFNRDLWNELPDELKSLCVTAIDATTARKIVESYALIDEAWTLVAEEGVEIIEWPAEDMVVWTNLQLDYL